MKWRRGRESDANPPEIGKWMIERRTGSKTDQRWADRAGGAIEPVGHRAGGETEPNETRRRCCVDRSHAHSLLVQLPDPSNIPPSALLRHHPPPPHSRFLVHDPPQGLDDAERILSLTRTTGRSFLPPPDSRAPATRPADPRPAGSRVCSWSLRTVSIGRRTTSEARFRPRSQKSEYVTGEMSGEIPLSLEQQRDGQRQEGSERVLEHRGD